MRKIISALAASSAVILAVSGCAASPEANGMTTVRLNEVVHSVFYAPQYVALANGYFEDEGLTIELSVGNGADKSMTALLSDSADIALLGTEAGIYVINEGRENSVKAFAQLTQRAGNFLISRTDGENFDWESLRGKSVIGGRKGGMPELVLEYVLKQKGLENDVEIINNISFESTAGAFAADVGDFTVEFEPHATLLEQKGDGYVVASLGEDSGYVPYTAFSARKSYMDANPDVIRAFTAALQKGMDYVQNHTPEEIAAVIQPQFEETDVETITTIVTRYYEQDSWKDNLVFEEEAFTLLQNILEEAGELEKRVPYENLVDTSFAEEVK